MMIKKETISRLLNEKVISTLEKSLEQYDFIYNKSRSSFVRKIDEFEACFNISNQSASIEYDEEKESVKLLFNCIGNINLPNYNKWYEKQLGEKLSFSKQVFNTKIYTYLNFNDFTSNDFFTPSDSAKFKSFVRSSLINKHDDNIDVLNIESFITNIPEKIKELNSLSNIENIFNSREFQLSQEYINLLVYIGEIEKAKEYYEKTYHSYLQILSKNIDKLYLEGLEKHIKISKLLLNIEFENPYLPKVKITENRNYEIVLTENFIYRSTHEFKFENSKIKSALFNPNTGETYLLLENNTLFKIDKKGEICFNEKIQIETAFGNAIYTAGLCFIKNSNILLLGKFLLSDEGLLINIEKLITTELPPKKKVNFMITDAVFDESDRRYYLLCSFNNYNSIICILDEWLNYISEKLIYGTPIVLIHNKKWVIVNNGKHSFYDYSGKNLFELEYGNGNTNIAVSNNTKYAVSFGYATKSDLYDLESLKSKVIWAHPTYLKNYKEILYNDTHHNFDLSIAKFSPDDTYLVGGGHHGKYVAWQTEKFERFELIPKLDYLHLFEEAEIIDLNGSKFLKNRYNPMKCIQYFNSSNNFITELGNLYLIWDSNFNNIGVSTHIGKMKIISDDYISTYENYTFILYKKESK